MRGFLLFVAVMCVLPVYGAGESESVAAISYNPSRLGAYSHLKIAKKADFKGINVVNADVNMMTKGTIEVTNTDNRGACTPAKSDCYQINKVLPMAADPDYCVDYSDSCTEDAENFATNLATSSNTIVQGAVTDSTKPYITTIPTISSSEDWPGDNGISLKVDGGTINYVGSSSSVFVKQLVQTAGNLDEAFVLDASSGKVIMNEGKKIKVNRVFTLGNTEITAPGPSNKVTGLRWYDRTDKNGKKANVLTVFCKLGC